MNARILVVEDERAIQLALSGLLRREGYEVEVAGSGEDALALLRDATFDLVITDLALGRGISGMDVLREAKQLRDETLVVMITAHGSEAIAVEAMKAGAEDYIPKPFDNDEIRLVVHKALDRTRLERENRLLLEQVQRQYGFENLIGSGPAMRRVFETLSLVGQLVRENESTTPAPDLWDAIALRLPAEDARRADAPTSRGPDWLAPLLRPVPAAAAAAVLAIAVAIGVTTGDTATGSVVHWLDTGNRSVMVLEDDAEMTVIWVLDGAPEGAMKGGIGATV